MGDHFHEVRLVVLCDLFSIAWIEIAYNRVRSDLQVQLYYLFADHYREDLLPHTVIRLESEFFEHQNNAFRESEAGLCYVGQVWNGIIASAFKP